MLGGCGAVRFVVQWDLSAETETTETQSHRYDDSKVKDTMSKKKTARKQHEQNKVTVDPGIPCVHCRARYGHRATNTYGNGNRRMLCGTCGKPFITVLVMADVIL